MHVSFSGGVLVFGGFRLNTTLSRWHDATGGCPLLGVWVIFGRVAMWGLLNGEAKCYHVGFDRSSICLTCTTTRILREIALHETFGLLLLPPGFNKVIFQPTKVFATITQKTVGLLWVRCYVMVVMLLVIFCSML